MRLLVTVLALVVMVFAGELNATLGKKKVEDDEGSATVEKRGSDSTEDFNNFIEQKLMQQSQALEHLIKVVDNSGDMIKKLINNLSKGMEKPKLPIKAEVEEVFNVKHSNSTEEKDHPIVRLSKHISKYGKLAKDLIMKDIHTGTDPTPLVEKDPDLSSLLEM